MKSVLITAVVLGGFVCFAPRAIAGPAPSPSTLLQAALDRRTARAPGTGIVVGIIERGNVTTYVSGSSGNARPLDAQTRFEIGSVSKTFTATLLALAVQAGKLTLSDPLAKYLPKTVRVPAKDGKSITLLELAEQRSGLPRLPENMSDVAGSDPYAGYSRKDMYAFLNGYSLTRDPGAEYEYSNFGIGVLGQALANAAQTTYSRLLDTRVLDPLRMSATSLATPDAADASPLATGHDVDGNPVAPWHFDAIAPAGGVRSDLDDMLKYLRCNMGQGPLASACLFAQKARAAGEAGHRIGLVWWTNLRNGVVSHAGDTAGFHAEIAISADKQTGVVVMSNGPIVTDIAAHVLNPAYPIAECPSTVDAADTDPSSYRGEYCATAIGLAFRVFPSAVPNSVLIRVEGQSSLSYVETGPDEYTNAVVNATATFIRRNGSVVGIRFVQAGAALLLDRLNAQGSPVAGNLSQWPAVVTLDAATLLGYTGSYIAPDGTQFVVALRGDRLYVTLTGQPAVPVYPSAKDEFFYKVVAAEISFGRDASGNVVALTL
ncbi:MAG: serine hydrolase, partial [Candidatus Baltobacteraceae bacterium]